MSDGAESEDDSSLFGPTSEYEEIADRYREPEPDDPDLGPDIPEAPDPTTNDVDPELSARFWALVLVFNVALLGIGIGALLAVADGNVELGGQLFAGGCIVFAYGVYRYREAKRQFATESTADGSSDGAASANDESEGEDGAENNNDEGDLPPVRGAMQTVRDEDGRRYLRLKRSGESSLVRDPETGERRHVPNDGLEAVDRPPLATVAEAVPDDLRTVLTAVPDDRGLGLLLELDARDGMAARDLLAASELCESDLHGMLAEYRAAGLVEETEIGGERGYETTDAASAALGRLRRAKRSTGPGERSDT